MTRSTKHDVHDCSDPACVSQGCVEHPFHNGGDHTYEQHHDPSEHVGEGPCECPVYQDDSERGSAKIEEES